MAACCVSATCSACVVQIPRAFCARVQVVLSSCSLVYLVVHSFVFAQVVQRVMSVRLSNRDSAGRLPQGEPAERCAWLSG